jgi:hypothetical protein
MMDSAWTSTAVSLTFALERGCLAPSGQRINRQIHRAWYDSEWTRIKRAVEAGNCACDHTQGFICHKHRR